MVCPKCGANVEDTATVCEYCNEKLEPVVKAEEGAEAPAKAAKFDLKKIDLKKIDFKNKKTWLALGAGVVALVLAIVIICAVVGAVANPQTIAEKYVEAYLDGDIKDVLKKSAPWVVRETAVEYDLKETASVSKIAREIEDYDDFEGEDGKVKIVRSVVLAWCDDKYDNASGSVFNVSNGMKFSEAKNIKEYARVRVYYTITQKGEEPDEYSMTVHLAKVGGSWYVLNEIDD